MFLQSTIITHYTFDLKEVFIKKFFDEKKVQQKNLTTLDGVLTR
jgi:hypothetical protein